MAISVPVPAIRVRAINDAPIRADGDYVLYWMIASRRTRWNFALERAVDRAHELGRPLLILEALRCDYPWASDRLHRFVIQGMADNARDLASARATYYPYVEPELGAGKGLLETLAKNACVVVTDDFPCFFLPRMVAVAGKKLATRLEAVDGNGLLPLRAADKVYKRAVDFRRHLQKTLPEHLGDTPKRNPLARVKLPRLDAPPRAAVRRWRPAKLDALLAPGGLDPLPLDHDVAPVSYDGGSAAAEAQLELFLEQRLERYAEGRREVSDRATSELSPYLHFGHVSAHQVFARLARREDWDPGDVAASARGARAGWWGMSVNAESFLDELITWRELGYNMTARLDDYDRYETLPAWARKTLEEHLDDERPHLYDLEAFETAATADELWNAAQRELLRDGRIHNYMRMLWGKKVLEWSSTPRDALAVMIELNNKYGVDGRNPNTYSGVFWCLGRYDRAWGPERPIYGKVRYMSSDSTRRKLDAKAYVAEFGPPSESV